MIQGLAVGLGVVAVLAVLLYAVDRVKYKRAIDARLERLVR